MTDTVNEYVRPHSHHWCISTLLKYFAGLFQSEKHVFFESTMLHGHLIVFLCKVLSAWCLSNCSFGIFRVIYHLTLRSSVSKGVCVCVWIWYQIWIISIRRPGHSRWLPHHLLISLTVDLWDESWLPQRLHGSWLTQFSASINRKVLKLLTQVQFNRKCWYWSQQGAR